MEKRLRTRASFAAGISFHDGDVARQHGHHYTVEVTSVTIDWRLPRDLETVASELRNRTLEDMMPGASVDLDGIAAWFLERLILEHQGITEIWVTEDDGRVSGGVVRPLRAPVR